MFYGTVVIEQFGEKFYMDLQRDLYDLYTDFSCAIFLMI